VLTKPFDMTILYVLPLLPPDPPDDDDEPVLPPHAVTPNASAPTIPAVTKPRPLLERNAVSS
jgi:hypothetical protein